MVSSSIIDNVPIPPHKVETIQMITCLVILYAVTQLLEAGRDIITDNLMAVFCTQAEDGAKVWAHSVSIPTP